MTKPGQDTEILDEKILRSFPVEKRYLIGVSGGRDSVALLHALVRRGFQKLIVCHLDHGLRGRTAQTDARFVAKLADSLGCSFAGGVADVRTLATKQKQSIETTGRAERLRFFAQVARQRRCPIVFLAHHADDLVETFLFNLFRGAGMTGLGGIRETALHRSGSMELTLVRPLLGVWRSDIDAYVKRERLKFREDKTNRDLVPLRNRLRQRVIPYLEKVFGRDLRKSLWRAAMIAAEEDAWMNSSLPAVEAELSVEVLRAQPIAGQRRVIRRWLRQHEVANLGFDLIERVRALLEPDALQAKTNLPRDRHVRRRAKKLFVDG